FFSCLFSSRRRHTTSKRDWSSDVCSSDLAPAFCACGSRGYPVLRQPIGQPRVALLHAPGRQRAVHQPPAQIQFVPLHGGPQRRRSEERRVGKERISRAAPEREEKQRKIEQ